MAMIRCNENEHRFDDTKHSSCPFCIKERGNNDKTSVINKKPPISRTSLQQETKDNSPKKEISPKTVAPWARKKKREESLEETETSYSQAPVVGWLVIVEGLQKGRDFRIIPGINKIGRASSNEININNGDTEISREKHCLIEYDLKSGQFYIERGATSTYHNNGRVGGNGNELALGDTIQIGNTTLKFIPFCDNDFCWEM